MWRNVSWLQMSPRRRADRMEGFHRFMLVVRSFLDVTDDWCPLQSQEKNNSMNENPGLHHSERTISPRFTRHSGVVLLPSSAGVDTPWRRGARGW